MNNLNCNKIIVGRCRVKIYTNSDNHSQFDCAVDCVQINRTKTFVLMFVQPQPVKQNAVTDLEFLSCTTVNAVTTLEFLKL